MTFWKKWFSKSSRAGKPEALHGDMSMVFEPEVTCPFCNRRFVSGETGPFGYEICRCSCGSLGSGSPMLPDLDEVADQLLHMLHLELKVSEPIVPVRPADHPQISIQRYDIDKAKRDFQQILDAHEYETRFATESHPFDPGSESAKEIHMHMIWVKKRE